MGNLLRSVGGVIAGLAAGVLVIFVVEFASSKVYPLPAGVDPADTEAFKLYVAQLPLGAYLFVLAGWGAGNLSGSWVATRVGPGRSSARGIIVGVGLLVAAVSNMLMLPHPLWFWAAAFMVLTATTYLGVKLGLARS
jgi:hypothetical protein